MAYRRITLVLVADALLAALALFFAFFIRFDLRVTPAETRMLLLAVGPTVVVRAVVFIGFRLYRKIWDYASIDELLMIALATAIGSVVLGTGFLILIPGYPRGVILLDAVLCGLFVGGARLAWRLVRARVSFPGPSSVARGAGRRPRRVLVVGAGDAGAMVVREMKKSRSPRYQPVGFIDDNLGKKGFEIHGVRVLGCRYDIARLVQEERIDEVVLAIPSVGGAVARDIVSLVRSAGVSVGIKTLPGVGELLDGKVTVSQIRNVLVEDLIRRDVREMPNGEASGYIKGRRVLVTGAGGSIGSELARQVATLGPEVLVLAGQGENSIYQTEQEFARLARKPEIIPVMGDVKDGERLGRIFERYRPQVVFHAAAYKHVPLMEVNAEAAVLNNIVGTRVAAECALRHGVERFIYISTDKAVAPTSVMGATKRVGELIVLAEAENGRRKAAGGRRRPERQSPRRHATRFIITRFGNVLDSRGSVIPFFKRQIAEGGPVTVTHPDVRRFFMTIPEAVQLVILGGLVGQNGDILALDMGEQIRIYDLAQDMIRQSGFEPGREIKIVFTGLRPGEKLTEELVGPGETIVPTALKSIVKVIPPQAPDGAGLFREVDKLVGAARAMDRAQVIDILRAIVPEYRPTGPNGRSGPSGRTPRN